MKFAVVAGLLAGAVVLSGCTAPTPEPTTMPTLAPVVPSPTATSSPALVDGGAREGAQGSVVLDDAGLIVGYVVAEGDASSLIAARFGLESLGQIVNSDGLKVGDNIPIHAGEELRLVAND